MKNRTIRHLAMVAVAGSLALSGCVKDDPAANGGTFTGKGLRLHAEHPNDTKTTVDGLNVYWAEDDRVLINGTPIYVNVDGTRTQAEIDFDNSATDVLVIYPHTICNESDPSAENIEVNLPRSYEYKEVDGRQHLNLPMVGKATAGAASITLKHICGAVDVQVTNTSSRTLYMDSIMVGSPNRLSGHRGIDISDMANFSIEDVGPNGGDDMSAVLWFAHEQHSIGAGETRTFQVPVLPCWNPDVMVFAHSDAIPGVIAKPAYCYQRTAQGKTIARAQVMSAATRIPDRNYCQLPTAFSVSDSKKVYFSQGNLIYNPAQNVWDFNSPQTAYQGESNRAVSSTYDGWIDLFGWGTGTNPTNTSGNDSDYPTYYEWGNNPIGTLGNTPGQWYTLNKDEWQYLLNGRPYAATKRCLATVDGTPGLVLFPDLFFDFFFEPVNDNFTRYDDNHFTSAVWANLEALGAIFLPAAAYTMRDPQWGNMLIMGEGTGCYWTSTPHSESNRAHLVEFQENFGENNLVLNSYFRSVHASVRLVTDAN